MKNRIRGWVLLVSATLLLSAGLVGLPATTAIAHGTCVQSTSDVIKSGGKAHGNISRSCGNSHYNLWVTGVLQEFINGAWFCVPSCTGTTDNAYNTTFIQWNQTGAHDVTCLSTQTTRWRVWRKDAGAFATPGAPAGHVIGSAFGGEQMIGCRV